MRGRRVAAAALLAGLLATACAVDPSAVTLSAEPIDQRIPSDAAASPADPTVPGSPTSTLPTAGTAPPTTVAPTTLPPTTTTTVPPTTTTTVPPTTTTTEPPLLEPRILADVALEDVADLGGDKPPRPHDAVAAATLADLDRWWSDVYPEVYGEPFVPLRGAVYVGYPERDADIPGCAEPRTDYEDLQLFAAFYCQIGDFIAYDDGTEAPSTLGELAESFGPAVMGVVLAHEYGHAIQQRAGALDRRLATIVTEQQADCFAGAWTGQAYRGESPLLQLGDLDVRAGLLAMIEVRDPVGTSQFDAGGHGSAFDRVGAFQVGFISGPGRCAELIDDPLPLVPNVFRSPEDSFRGGDAPYDCVGEPASCTPAPTFLAEDLDHFWATTFADELGGTGFAGVTVLAVDDLATACASPRPLALHVAVCDAERIVAYDEPEVRALYDELGDFTLGYLYGIAWSDFALQTLGRPLEGERRALVTDCFTGAWVRDITPDSAGATPRGGVDRDGDGTVDGVITSPGDLDEAIQMAIVVGDQSADDDLVGSPFEKIDAFRTGVLGGLDACLERLDR